MIRTLYSGALERTYTDCHHHPLFARLQSAPSTVYIESCIPQTPVLRRHSPLSETTAKPSIKRIAPRFWQVAEPSDELVVLHNPMDTEAILIAIEGYFECVGKDSAKVGTEC